MTKLTGTLKREVPPKIRRSGAERPLVVEVTAEGVWWTPKGLGRQHARFIRHLDAYIAGTPFEPPAADKPLGKGDPNAGYMY